MRTVSGPFHKVVASDVIRDGLGVELIAGDETVAEVFRCDADHSLVITTFSNNVPLVAIEELVAVARSKLRAFEDGTPLPAYVSPGCQAGSHTSMSATHLQTKSLELVPLTLEEVRAMVETMSPSEQAQLSADWLARLHASTSADPWTHGFSLVHRDSRIVVGKSGFKGPPAADGVVEIAYGVAPEHQGKGYATEAAQALVAFAFSSGRVRVVRAHTLPEANASTRVLTKCGFQPLGEFVDPEDGLVWRWEKHHEAAIGV